MIRLTPLSSSRNHLLASALAVSLWLLPAAVSAHDFTITETLVVLKNDGTFQVDMTCDLDALALGASPDADSAALAEALQGLPPEDLEERVARLGSFFERRVRLRFDGEPAPFRVSFPERGEPALAAAVPSFLGVKARLEGRVPEGATELVLRASRSFPAVHLTVLEQESLGGSRQLVNQGEPSEPYLLGQGPSEPSAGVLAGQYLFLGFWHIVPEGLDHILFVLGLFLLGTRWKPLLWQVTAFTAAHTVSLALSAYGVVSLSAAVVEPLIALSIAWVAVENVVSPEMKPWRPALVFAFGLLHGLGFAGVLGELGLPEGERLTALLSFNLGVELGQLAVLLAAFALTAAFRGRAGYRKWVAVPASLAIAAVGLYWAVERTFF